MRDNYKWKAGKRETTGDSFYFLENSFLNYSPNISDTGRIV